MKTACLPNILTRVDQPIGLSCESDTHMRRREGTKPTGPVGQLDETVRHDGFVIEEIGTAGYSSLEDAQEAASSALAEVLAQAIRSGLDNGRYVTENGFVRIVEEARDE